MKYKKYNWTKTQNIYLRKYCVWLNDKKIQKQFNIDSFPLLQCSRLAEKDTSSDRDWFIEIHNRLNGKNPCFHKAPSTLICLVKITKGFLIMVLSWVALKISISTQRPPQNSKAVLFHVLESNILRKNKILYDRNFGQAPLKDQKNNRKTYFLMRQKISKKTWVENLKLFGKKKLIESQFNRPVIYLDSFLKISDIFRAYFYPFFLYLKCLKIFKLRQIKINKVCITDIFLYEIQKSLISSIPWALCGAFMFVNFGKKLNIQLPVVTYGDTVAPMRPAYFFTRRNKIKITWVAVQHCTLYRHKISHRHSPLEIAFGKKNKTTLNWLLPDFYFAHGPAYTKILKTFFPSKRIRTIGCLKYD